MPLLFITTVVLMLGDGPHDLGQPPSGPSPFEVVAQVEPPQADSDGKPATGGGNVAGTAFDSRTPAGRLAAVKANGGNSKSEDAVARGLIWLAKQQKPNGAWVYDGTSSKEVVAATGMALLPFMAAGQTHKPAPGNPFQKSVEAGLAFLIGQQGPDGAFYNNRDARGQLKGRVGTYAQGIATIAVCDAYGMTGDKRHLHRPAQKAVDYLVAIQAEDGSWGYSPNKSGDTSIVGWQIQALQAGKMCKGLMINRNTVNRTSRFLDSVSDPETHPRYGYRDRRSVSPARTAIGLLCRYYIDGWGPTNPSMAAGVDYLMKTMPGPKAKFDMYYFYYATLVMFYNQGPNWHEKWNPAMREMLLSLQVPMVKGANVGSWDADAGSIGQNCGRLGTTCLAVLTLEIYYRQVPLYKRGTDGLKILEGDK